MDTDTQDYVARRAAAGDALSAADQAAYDGLVTSLKANGVWDKLVELTVMMGGTFAGALVKLKYDTGTWAPGTGTAPITNFGFVEADYSPLYGLTGDGTGKYLDTNCWPTYFGLTGTNQCFGVFVSSDAGNMEGISFGNGQYYVAYYSGDMAIGSITVNHGGAPTVGLHVVTMDDDSTAKYYFNGELYSATVLDSPAQPDTQPSVFRFNGGLYSDNRIRAYLISNNLTAADVRALDHAMSQFIGRIAATRRNDTVVVLGDSITRGVMASDLDGANVHSYPALVAEQLGLELVRYGHDAQTLCYKDLTNLLVGERVYIGQVCDRNPRKVVIAYGTNDVNADAASNSPDLYCRTYVAVVQRIVLMTGLRPADVVICGPTYLQTYQNQGSDARCVEYDRAAQQAALLTGCAYAGVREAMLAAGEVTADGIHPRDDGHATWARTIVTALRQAGATGGVNGSALLGLY